MPTRNEQMSPVFDLCSSHIAQKIKLCYVMNVNFADLLNKLSRSVINFLLSQSYPANHRSQLIIDTDPDRFWPLIGWVFMTLPADFSTGPARDRNTGDVCTKGFSRWLPNSGHFLHIWACVSVWDHLGESIAKWAVGKSWATVSGLWHQGVQP